MGSLHFLRKEEVTPTLLDYQEASVEFLSKRKRAMIVAPAGAGKTFMAAGAIKRVLEARRRESKVRVAWVANTREQIQQGLDALRAFDILDSIDLTIECPAGMPEDWVGDLLVIDEFHHGPAKSWAAIADRHRGALWGFTATPFGEDKERNDILRAMINNEIHVVPRSAVASRVVSGEVRMLSATDEPKILQATIDEAISKELGRMVPRVLYMRKFDYWRRIADSFCEKHSIARNGASLEQLWAALNRGAHREALQKALFTACSKDMWPRVAFRMCLDIGIAENERRNSAIVRLAGEHRRDAVLILVNTVIHGTALAERLDGAVVCHSKMGAKFRRNAIEKFRDGRLWCLIATSLADEGLDVPRANVLILAGAGRSSAKTEQRTGRVLRAFGDKERGRIYDFTDPQHPLLASQSRKRQALYRELGYSVEAHNPDQRALFT